MKIVEVNSSIIERLRESRLSQQMRSLENCKFLVMVEYDGKIVGASGIGGILNVPSLQVHPDYAKKGLGAKLLKEVIDEAKRRKYSFICGCRDPLNLDVVRIHDFFELNPLLRVKYSPEYTTDVIFMAFNKKGRLLANFINLFNNQAGMFFFVTFLKIFKKFVFKRLFTLSDEDFPSPSIIFALKNFEKL